MTTIKRWKLIVMKVPYNSVFVFPFNFPKPNMQIHLIPKNEIQIALKNSTFCNICLSQSSDPVIKNYNMCNNCKNVQALTDILKSWCRLIFLYPLSHKLFAAQGVEIPWYKNTSYLKPKIRIKYCRNSWHIDKSLSLTLFLDVI